MSNLSNMADGVERGLHEDKRRAVRGTAGKWGRQQRGSDTVEGNTEKQVVRCVNISTRDLQQSLVHFTFVRVIQRALALRRRTRNDDFMRQLSCKC